MLKVIPFMGERRAPWSVPRTRGLCASHLGRTSQDGNVRVLTFTPLGPVPGDPEVALVGGDREELPHPPVSKWDGPPIHLHPRCDTDSTEHAAVLVDLDDVAVHPSVEGVDLVHPTE